MRSAIMMTAKEADAYEQTLRGLIESLRGQILGIQTALGEFKDQRCITAEDEEIGRAHV